MKTRVSNSQRKYFVQVKNELDYFGGLFFEPLLKGVENFKVLPCVNYLLRKRRDELMSLEQTPERSELLTRLGEMDSLLNFSESLSGESGAHRVQGLPKGRVLHSYVIDLSEEFFPKKDEKPFFTWRPSYDVSEKLKNGKNLSSGDLWSLCLGPVEKPKEGVYFFLSTSPLYSPSFLRLKRVGVNLEIKGVSFFDGAGCKAINIKLYDDGVKRAFRNGSQISFYEAENLVDSSRPFGLYPFSFCIENSNLPKSSGLGKLLHGAFASSR